MSTSILTVTQINTFIKSLIDGDGRLKNIFVSGEISNFTNHYKSGHYYFSLKDERSVIKSVMFSSSAQRLKFIPADGMKVIVRGRVSVYEASGQYQLYAEDMLPEGAGALSLAYEQTKEKLEKEGIFDAQHKKPLPRYPRKIGVITSETGAAVQDIIQITDRRWPVAEILLAPVNVQGELASAQLIEAVRAMDRYGGCSVIIIGRGGGSAEDLQAFNDEGLARAVYMAETPVVSAVGHETDFTICDFAADLRAPTPSAAAELVTPDIFEEKLNMRMLNERYTDSAENLVEAAREQVDRTLLLSPLESPEKHIDSIKERVLTLCSENLTLQANICDKKAERLRLAAETLEALSPLKILARGFGAVSKGNRPVKSAAAIEPGDEIKVSFSDGEITANVSTKDTDNNRSERD